MSASVSASDIPCGFTFAANHCGLKKTKLDLALIVSETPATAAAMFTTNLVKAAPLIVSQAHLRKSRSKIRAIIVNSGNANCVTGSEGYAASTATAEKLARELGRMDASQILVNSTGVIGVPLRVEKILDALPELVRVPTMRSSDECFIPLISGMSISSRTVSSSKISPLGANIRPSSKASTCEYPAHAAR